MSIESSSSYSGDNEGLILDWPQERLDARSRIMDAAVADGHLPAEQAEYYKTHHTELELGVAEAQAVLAQGPDAVAEWLLQGDPKYQRLLEKLQADQDA
jgi:hypothetical protein